MSAATDAGAEREVDLGAVWRSVVARWWIAAAGLVAGAVVGLLATLGGGTVYKASVLLAPGQAFSPNGNSNVLTYLTSQRAITEIVSAPATLAQVSAKSGLTVEQLTGHVTVGAPDTGATGTTVTGGRLVQITVEASKPKRAEDAADALAAIVQKETTSVYVLKSIEVYKTRLANYARRLTTLQKRIDELTKTLNDPTVQLAQLDRLVLVSELDQAQAAQGSLFDNQTLAEQQLTLAQQIELTQIIGGQAVAQKASTRSSRSSVVIGAVVGLIIGAIAAIVVDARARRARPA